MRQLKLMSAVLPLLLVVLTGCEREKNNGGEKKCQKV